MLVAYFDESGTHWAQDRAKRTVNPGEQCVITVAGLVGDSMVWSRLERPWMRRLGDIGYFHATDCAASDKQFRKIKKDECDSLSNDLASLIASQRSDLCAVGMSVYCDDWDYAASAQIKKQCRTMYHFCLLMVLVQVNQLSRERAGGDPVAFIFAKQPQFAEYTQAVHEVFQQIERYSSIGYLGFGEPKCIIPLQAADLFSYETYRELVAKEKSGTIPPMRTQLKTITEAIETRNRVATVEYLHAVSESIDGLFTSTQSA